MTEIFYNEGQVIEGTVTRQLGRDLLMDEWFTSALFLVTREPPSSRTLSTEISVAFTEGQADVFNPPDGAHIRATVSASAFAKAPFAVSSDTFMLTDIEFIDPQTRTTIRRIPSAPTFDD